MGKVIWSPTAHNDINLIAEYIARDSEERASLFVTKLIEQTDKLKTYPRAGRKIPELNETSKREIIYGSYRIMYKIIKNGDVWITSVVHGARDWQP
jgi:plasmid stabilization system protein ParE